MPNRSKERDRRPAPVTPLPAGTESELFRLVVEAAPNAIVVTNADGKIELVNQQAERLFRYSRDELLGKRVEQLIPERFRHHHPGLRGQFMAEPATRAMGAGRDLYACTKDGDEIPIEIGLNPIHTPEGTLVLSSIIDIRERKAAEERFRQQTEQIAAASRYKSEFLANMSHELRTPLNSILILSEQLKNNLTGNLTAKQVAHADIIHRSGSDLLALINDILDLSKIEAGRMSVVLEPLPMEEFAESIDRSFRPMAESRGLSFSVGMEPGAPPVIVSDHQRIFQIVRNLFSNALKFTAAGSIGIRIFGEGSGRARRLGIAVADSGIGIPEDKHELIFDAFRQVDGSTSRRFGGTGLGLSISRSLAQLLGGAIELQSRPGKGSTFTLLLPTGSVPDTAVQWPRPGVGPVVVAGDVLLVEDNPVEARHYAALIGELGFQVTTASDGRGALQACRRRQFSCIVIDLALPDLPGTELIEALHAEQLTDGAHLIVNTAYSLNEAEYGRLRDAGIPVLTKSADNEPRLLEAIRLRQRAPLPLPEPAPSSQGAGIASPFAGRRMLLVDDDIRNIYAMSSLVEELGFDVEFAMNGQQAIEAIERELPFDIVLMDMMMPIMDGYQATLELKQNRGYNKPVIAVTAHAMKGDREKCLQAGADDYLAKPVNRTELAQMLGKWLEPSQCES